MREFSESFGRVFGAWLGAGLALAIVVVLLTLFAFWVLSHLAPGKETTE